MRVLVRVHTLELGGSQINAIDLAAAVRGIGHEVVVFAPPGPLEERIDQRGLRMIRAAGHPPRTPQAIGELRGVARAEGADLVHAYEYYPCLEAFYGPHMLGGLPIVGTVLSMSVPRFIPRWMPLIVGTDALARDARRRWRAPVMLLEPPVDTEEDRPDLDPDEFRRQLRLDGLPTVVIVSRLTREMKLESVEATIEAVAALDAGCPAQLVIVGTGDAYSALAERAVAVNRRLGRRAVILAGPIADPRPAYAAADVVVGMGSSMLRGMAFAKPGIVTGERGFAELVSPDTIDRFLRDGFYGIGDGRNAAPTIALHLAGLLPDARRRSALGDFGRGLVCERFDLRVAARRLGSFYEQVASRGVKYRGIVADSIRIGSRIGWEATTVLSSRALRRVGIVDERRAA